MVNRSAASRGSPPMAPGRDSPYYRPIREVFAKPEASLEGAHQGLLVAGRHFAGKQRHMRAR